MIAHSAQLQIGTGDIESGRQKLLLSRLIPAPPFYWIPQFDQLIRWSTLDTQSMSQSFILWCNVRPLVAPLERQCGLPLLPETVSQSVKGDRAHLADKRKPFTAPSSRHILGELRAYQCRRAYSSANQQTDSREGESGRGRAIPCALATETGK